MEALVNPQTIVRLASVLVALPLLAGQDPNEIVKRFLEADKTNRELVMQYTFVEQAIFFSVDKAGQSRKNRSATHEIVFVEGGAYKKLIARNDKPLDPKEQAKEDKKLQQTAEERRKQRRSGFFTKTVSLGSHDDLLTLFDNRLAGEEEIHGHKAWVIVSTPKVGRVPADAKEKETLGFERKLWIDIESQQILKSIYTVVGKSLVLMPASTISTEYRKINDDAWLPVSLVIDGRLQFAKLVKPGVRTEYTNSKFQKFDVQSTITLEK